MKWMERRQSKCDISDAPWTKEIKKDGEVRLFLLAEQKGETKQITYSFMASK